MNGRHFGNKTGKSYYFNTIASFLNDNPTEILGKLVSYGAKYGFDTTVQQSDAWVNQIFELQQKLKDAGCSGDIIFEYDIVRMGKRIDVVLLIKHMVFSLEFKNGFKKYNPQHAEQAEDYATDLKNFHKESENLYVCPILVATDAPAKKNIIDSYSDKQVFLQYANKNNLMKCIADVYKKYGDDKSIDFDTWYNSPYCPTPTIIDAAVTAYREHTVENIRNSEAGQEGVDRCEAEISKIIDDAKKNNKKCICFITGVPGAGKTLVGLNIAAKYLCSDRSSSAVYLSGNDPLVDVLRKALVLNNKQRLKDAKQKTTKQENKNFSDNVNAFIQKAYSYRKASILDESLKEPFENIIVFDEAQRCWNSKQLNVWTKSKMGMELNVSEPDYFISVMDRKIDWSVIICLVGLGQDINDGETGINEWFESIIHKYTNWDVYYSSMILNQLEDSLIDKEAIKSYPRAHAVDDLHLSVDIRSYRSEKLSEFVGYLLDNNPQKAKQVYKMIKKSYPLYITRDLKKAKQFARQKVRGSQRCGVVACSSAKRLKPDGLFVQKEIDVESWFLAPQEDLRSSNAMEVVASEFKIQGLEIDYSVVCWDADLRREKGEWAYYRFKGTKWQERKTIEQRRYLINAYRVLLTRARQSMVIFVPNGDETGIDKTRNIKFYNDIYHYLHIECGIEDL